PARDERERLGRQLGERALAEPDRRRLREDEREAARVVRQVVEVRRRDGDDAARVVQHLRHRRLVARRGALLSGVEAERGERLALRRHGRRLERREDRGEQRVLILVRDELRPELVVEARLRDGGLVRAVLLEERVLVGLGLLERAQRLADAPRLVG